VTKPSTSTPSSDAAHADAQPDAKPGASGVSDVAPRGSSVPGLLRKCCPACGERYPSHFVVCPRDATQLREELAQEQDPLIGTVLAETYEVLRVIGEGGMGRVYEARHTRLFSKRFAIKVLHGDLTRQPEVVGRFLREAEATSALHHPNIVGVLDVNQVPDGRPYIVAELLEGSQLGDYFERQGKLPVAEAVAICRSICQALIAAHERDIVHRDIKPENLFLVGEGSQRTVKVLDFGISLMGDAAASLTKTGMVMGTPAYMPPEQARGQRVDHRADVYAVGAILYEAVTGKAPFKGADPVSTLGAVLTQLPVPARSHTPALPEGLEDVIHKAMSKGPDQRYATMRDLDAALAEFDQNAALSGISTSQRLSIPPPVAAVEPPANLLQRLVRLYTDGGPEHARDHLWVLSAAYALFLLAGLVAFSTGILRLGSEAGLLTVREAVMCVLAAVVVTCIPAIAWAQHLFWHVWPSTQRVVETLATTRRVLAASMISYAAGMSLMRLIGAVGSSPGSLAWPGWDLFVFPLSLLVGGAFYWFERKLRGRSS
jgi:serine/threonine protein kinase